MKNEPNPETKERMGNLRMEIINLCAKHNIDVPYTHIRYYPSLNKWGLVLMTLVENKREQI